MADNTPARAKIILYIDPQAYKDESGIELTKQALENQGRYVNDDAVGMLGYEGWRTVMPGEDDYKVDIPDGMEGIPMVRIVIDGRTKWVELRDPVLDGKTITRDELGEALCVKEEA